MNNKPSLEDFVATDDSGRNLKTGDVLDVEAMLRLYSPSELLQVPGISRSTDGWPGLSSWLSA
jgi:hypothetical protein